MKTSRRAWWFLLAGSLTLLPIASDSSTDSTAAQCAHLAEYRSLDFTIGTWTTTDRKGSFAGTSTIKYDLDGCMLIETWRGRGVSGRNLDAYNAEDKHWHRFFVNSLGKVHVFEGISDGTSIRYEGTSADSNGKNIWNRLTIRKDGPNKVAQLWQKSSDGGKTWQTAFQAIYIRT